MKKKGIVLARFTVKGPLAKILSKPYLDSAHYMIRCPKCDEVVDKRKHGHP